MAKALTVTLSDRVHAALTRKGAEIDLDAPGYLRFALTAAGVQASGFLLQLELPPLPKGDAPLFEAMGIEPSGGQG